MYLDVYNRWYRARRSGHAPMPREMMDLEMKFFTASRCGGNIHGFNMNPGFIRPEKVRELARRPTSDAPNILDKESLVVLVKRASELLQLVGVIRPFARMVLRTYKGMKITNNHKLDLTLRPTRDNEDTEQLFIQQFRAHSEVNYELSELEVSFFRSTAHYMTRRWIYDHEYFQRMIERDARTNPDMNIALGIKEGNPEMIARGIEQGIHDDGTIG